MFNFQDFKKKTLNVNVKKASDSPSTQFPENRLQTPSLTLRIIKLSSSFEKLMEKTNEEFKIMGKPSVLMSQLHK